MQRVKEMQARLKKQEDQASADASKNVKAEAPDADAALKRKQRIAEMNKKFATPAADKPAVPNAALQNDKDLLNDTARKEKFKDSREAILRKLAAMQEQTRSRLIKMLNIRHLMMDEKAQAMEEVPVLSGKKTAKPMQQLSASNMFVSAPGQFVELMESPVAQSATMAELFDFAHLCQAEIATVPEGVEVTSALVTEKLEAFIQSSKQFDVDSLMTFIPDQQKYDELLLQLRKSSQQDRPRLEGAFLSFQAQFYKQNGLLMKQLLGVVILLSDLIAFLENNLGVGINVRQFLQDEYAAQGYPTLIQMKQILIQRCSPSLCVALEIKTDNSESVMDVVKNILMDEALRLGNVGHINKLVK